MIVPFDDLELCPSKPENVRAAPYAQISARQCAGLQIRPHSTLGCERFFKGACRSRSGEEISRKLVVTCGDGAEVLEPIEEALDQIAFTIECEVALPLDVSVGLGRNDRSDSTLGESFDERIGVISFVANQGLWVGVLD